MARPHPALLDIAAGRPVAPIADGEVLLSSAEEHRMSGLLWTEGTLAAVGLPGARLRAAALTHLRVRATQNSHRDTLQAVLGELDAVGVEALTFKGVAAEARWYDAIGERPCTDIDILVAPGAEDRAADIVRVLDPEHNLIADIEPLVAAGMVQTVTVCHRDTLIDVHFDLPALGVPTRGRDEVWHRSLTVDPGGERPVRVLDPETALIQLLLHLNKDCFARLLWYADIIRLISGEADLDWDYIDSYARREGLEAPIYLSLEAVYHDLGLPAPPHPAPTGWKRWLWLRLWPEKVRLQGMEGYFRRRHRRYVLAFMFTGRRRQAMRWWLRQLAPSDAMLKDWYPQARGPYLWRLVAARIGRGWRNRREARRARDPSRR